MITRNTNGAEFGSRWQLDRELVEGDNVLSAIREMSNDEVRFSGFLTRRLNSKRSSII